MKEFKYVIKDEIGIHARPAGLLVKEAKSFSSRITLSVNGKAAEATKLMSIMALGAKQGSEVTVTAEGADEEEAIARLKELMSANL